MQEIWVLSQGRDDSLEKEMATYSSILAWWTPWAEELTLLLRWDLASVYKCTEKLSFQHHFVVVQSLSCVQLFATPWTAACQASWYFTISWNLLRFTSIELIMLSNQLIPLLPSSPVFKLSQHHGLFQWVRSLQQVAKLSLQLQSFQWIFRVDFL